MKSTCAFLAVAAMASGLSSPATAQRRNAPKNNAEVEKMLEQAGGEHDPEGMKVGKVGYSKVEDTFYHIFCGTLDEGYRILIFDNTPSYLGFYFSEFEPVEAGQKEVLLDSGESDADGNTTYFRVRINEGGPAKRVNIDGIPTEFVRAPGREGAEKAAGATPAKEDPVEEEVKLEYREWTLSMGGQQHTFRAIFVKQFGNKVFLKEEKRGLTNDFPLNSFSAADREYIAKLPK